jgi:hypothetical protein
MKAESASTQLRATSKLTYFEPRTQKYREREESGGSHRDVIRTLKNQLAMAAGKHTAT